MDGDPRERVLLRLVGLEKSFPGVRALRGASLDLRAGEIHALVGENGAGKSTLIKIVTGAHAADAGRVELDGRRLAAQGPLAALRAGIAGIYQEFNLVPAMTVEENLFLGRETARFGLVARGRQRERATAVLAGLDPAIAPEAPVRSLSVARQQLVEIARALLAEARLLIMDEPTAALTPREVERLAAVLVALRAEGRGILFISHRLEEVRRLADRITVLRDGATLGTWPAAELPEARLIELMVGRPLAEGFPPRPARPAVPGPALLSAERLGGGKLRGVSLTLRAGEITGLAGLVGAGRTELARLLFGADRAESGRLVIDGRAVRLRSPREAIAQGICLLTEDRKGQGLVLALSAEENFALANLQRFSRGGWISRRRERAAFLRHVEALRIRIASPAQKAGQLSGGNQQKLLIARWLENDARVVLFDEPTRGIDVGAKAEIYALMRALAARGKAVLMISSELPEILGMSDRILVMHDGRITGEIADARAATQEDVLRLAVA